MINEQSIDTIDVCQKFFYTDDGPIKRYSYLFDVDNDIFMNQVVSKRTAIDFMKKIISSDENCFAELSVSLDTVKISAIEDFVGEKIFGTVNERYSGWLFQYDPTPFANWYHECDYYFVINQVYNCQVKSKRGLSDSIRMQSV